MEPLTAQLTVVPIVLAVANWHAAMHGERVCARVLCKKKQIQIVSVCVCERVYCACICACVFACVGLGCVCFDKTVRMKTKT